MKKIMVVFGTRPEAIKMCPLVKELTKRGKFKVVTAVTGQHREMLSLALRAFDVKPEYDLEIMREEQSLFDVTASSVLGLRRVLESESPDIVLVHGDTTTAFSAALSAFYLKIPIGHVEAGLRTGDIYSPFPEEFNRRCVGLLATYHFAPTDRARENLLCEGISESRVFVTGNTVVDAFKYTVRDGYSHEALEKSKGKRIFLTCHRRESIESKLENMLLGVADVLRRFTDVSVIFPVHPNKRVGEIAKRSFAGVPRIILCEPFSVCDCHNIMSRCDVILTDSGGLQEEGVALGKPTLVMRDVTERGEGIESGGAMLVGTTRDSVFSGLCKLLSDNELYSKMSNAKNPYGDGIASIRIADILEKLLK